jgi:hypothetical protein
MHSEYHSTQNRVQYDIPGNLYGVITQKIGIYVRLLDCHYPVLVLHSETIRQHVLIKK